MKFEIRNSNNKDQPYYWRIVASNGKRLAFSETYVNKADAKSAAQSVIDEASDATLVDLTK